MATVIKSKLQDVKRDLILKEASLLFESMGYEQLKVSDLAKSVGVSVGTIYGMFESKEGLYMAYVRYQIESYLNELDAQCKEAASAEEELRMVFELKFGHFVSNRKVIEECARNNPLFFSNIRHSVPDILAEAYTRVAEIIERINPELESAAAKRLAYTCIGLSDGVITYWLAADGDLNSYIEEMCMQMMLIIKGCK
jgi:AcrR family transcriptional regulator